MEKKKSITKEQIITTALALMHDKYELRTVNMREIARTLGCAHTNLYNYFASYTDLLWETHTALMQVLMERISEKLASATTAEMKLHCYFDTLIGVYLENKGWFRLAWMEYIGDDRPQKNVEATRTTHLALNRYLSEIWEAMTGRVPEHANIDRIVHTTHCYVIGEISNYISGRGCIENELEFKTSITDEAIRIMTLYMRKE